MVRGNDKLWGEDKPPPRLMCTNWCGAVCGPLLIGGALPLVGVVVLLLR